MSFRRARGVGLVEVLIGLALVGILLAVVIGAVIYGGRASARLTPQLSLQQASRKAIVRLIRGLQESMEVAMPRPGCTLPYAIVRDQVSRAQWYYQVPRPDGTRQLWRWVDDAGLAPDKRAELLISGVKRLTFTARSEGALQVNLLLGEGDHEYAMLTTVRLRNIASAEEVW